MLLEGPGCPGGASALLNELLVHGEYRLCCSLLTWQQFQCSPFLLSLSVAEFLFLPSAGDCPRLGCFVISRGCCLQLKEIAVLIYLLGVKESSLAASPGLSTQTIPRLSVVDVDSPALPLLVLLVMLGYVHRVPGRLQPEKGQQRVKPHSVCEHQLLQDFYHRLNCKVNITVSLPGSFSSCL